MAPRHTRTSRATCCDRQRHLIPNLKNVRELYAMIVTYAVTFVELLSPVDVEVEPAWEWPDVTLTQHGWLHGSWLWS
jgi:hypothetical protein